MKIEHPGGNHKIEISGLNERIEIHYRSLFSTESLELLIEPAIIGETIPILIFRIPKDYKLMTEEEDNKVYMVTPNINTNGWKDIK